MTFGNPTRWVQTRVPVVRCLLRARLLKPGPPREVPRGALRGVRNTTRARARARAHGVNQAVHDCAIGS